MKEKIALVTDSGSSLTVKTCKEYGIYVLTMPVIIGDDSFIEDVTITQEEFVAKLRNKALPKTSQPAIGESEELYNQLLEEYDYVIVVPMNRSLSSTFEMQFELAKKYNGRVYVADHRVVSGALLYSLKKIKNMIDSGKTFKEICNYLENNKDVSTMYLIPYDISHLKRTGRTSATLAFLANLLNLYPILSLKGTDNFKSVTKVRSFRKAITEVVKLHVKDGVDPKEYAFIILQIDNEEYARVAAEEVRKHFGEDAEIETHVFSPVIASHTGLKTVAVAVVKKTG